ncbi:hypothetical protein RRG08_007545 [Elysia crispata]|uniref:Uncharacterized protein n=1 Tax=Elysia crispata TaxID=231223 RepID=A0AAE0YGL3_9GAST|nr:hypothetical protein RRG08_007545 [Elysia crispata]
MRAAFVRRSRDDGDEAGVERSIARTTRKRRDSYQNIGDGQWTRLACLRAYVTSTPNIKSSLLRRFVVLPGNIVQKTAAGVKRTIQVEQSHSGMKQGREGGRRYRPDTEFHCSPNLIGRAGGNKEQTPRGNHGPALNVQSRHVDASPSISEPNNDDVLPL